MGACKNVWRWHSAREQHDESARLEQGGMAGSAGKKGRERDVILHQGQAVIRLLQYPST